MSSADNLWPADSVALSQEDSQTILRRRGATFDRGKHLAGTEVKAITYSAMQIVEREGDAEVFVIVDI